MVHTHRDAYWCVEGLFNREHKSKEEKAEGVGNVVDLGLKMVVQVLEQRRVKDAWKDLAIRIGIHTGVYTTLHYYTTISCCTETSRYAPLPLHYSTPTLPYYTSSVVYCAHLCVFQYEQ